VVQQRAGYVVGDRVGKKGCPTRGTIHGRKREQGKRVKNRDLNRSSDRGKGIKRVGLCPNGGEVRISPPINWGPENYAQIYYKLNVSVPCWGGKGLGKTSVVGILGGKRGGEGKLNKRSSGDQIKM